MITKEEQYMNWKETLEYEIERGNLWGRLEKYRYQNLNSKRKILKMWEKKKRS